MSKKSIDSEIALTKVQRHQFIENMLLEDFPITPVLVSTCLNVVLAVASVAFQIVSIVLGTRLYQIYCG